MSDDALMSRLRAANSLVDHMIVQRDAALVRVADLEKALDDVLYIAERHDAFDEKNLRAASEHMATVCRRALGKGKQT